MSKGNSGDFQNRAAKKFRQLDEVATMSQRNIFRLLDDEIDTIVDQVARYRNHQGKFPMYVLNGFANLSTSKWFFDYLKDHVKVTKKNKIKTDLDDTKIDAIREILSRAYKKSVTNYYANQTQDFEDRNIYISKAFIMLDPVNYKLTKKLNNTGVELTKTQRRDLCVQIYGDPVHNIKFVCGIFDNSNVSDNKKMKLLKKMYGERFVTAVGAAMTMSSTKSDFLSMCYTYLMDTLRKKKKTKTLKNRAKFVRAYAQAYKYNQSSYFKLKDGRFYEENKPLIKELVKEIDVGYKKAFKHLKPKDTGVTRN